MAFTSADADTLRAAIASGVKRVTFSDGRTTEYQSVDAMILALDKIEGDLRAADAAIGGRPRLRFYRHGRGW